LLRSWVNVWFRSEIRRVPAIGGESTVVPIDLPEGFNPPVPTNIHNKFLRLTAPEYLPALSLCT
jgi:hypothetical protein